MTRQRRSPIMWRRRPAILCGMILSIASAGLGSAGALAQESQVTASRAPYQPRPGCQRWGAVSSGTRVSAAHSRSTILTVSLYISNTMPSATWRCRVLPILKSTGPEASAAHGTINTIVEDDLIVAQSINDCHQDPWRSGNDGEQHG